MPNIPNAVYPATKEVIQWAASSALLPLGRAASRMVSQACGPRAHSCAAWWRPDTHGSERVTQVATSPLANITP